MMNWFGHGLVRHVVQVAGQGQTLATRIEGDEAIGSLLYPVVDRAVTGHRQGTERDAGAGASGLDGEGTLGGHRCLGQDAGLVVAGARVEEAHGVDERMEVETTRTGQGIVATDVDDQVGGGEGIRLEAAIGGEGDGKGIGHGDIGSVVEVRGQRQVATGIEGDEAGARTREARVDGGVAGDGDGRGRDGRAGRDRLDGDRRVVDMRAGRDAGDMVSAGIEDADRA